MAPDSTLCRTAVPAQVKVNARCIWHAFSLQPPSASARAKIRVTLLVHEVLPTGRKGSWWSVRGVICSFCFVQFFCKEGTSKLTNATVVSSSLCWGCNTTLCYPGFCHVTRLVITKAAFRIPFCDKAVVCTAPKNLNAVMKRETGKYLALVLSWAEHCLFFPLKSEPAFTFVHPYL